jgi:hypothetical protein
MQQRTKKRIQAWLWCTKHGRVSASVGCIHLLSGESEEWVQLNSPECFDNWLCLACQDRMHQSTLRPGEAMAVCEICLRDIHKSAVAARVPQVN